MKFTTLASTTSLAFVIFAHAQIVDPAVGTTAALTDLPAVATTINSLAPALTDAAIDTGAETSSATDATDTPHLSASSLSGLSSKVLTSTALAGVPGAAGTPGLAGTPGGAGVVPPSNSVRPTAIQPTATTASPVRPSFFPTATGGPASNAAQKSEVARKGTVYAVLGAIVAAMF